MNCDQSFIFRSFIFCELMGRLVDENFEHVDEALVHVLHSLNPNRINAAIKNVQKTCWNNFHSWKIFQWQFHFYLLIRLGIGQCIFRISRPQHLQTEDSYLSRENILKVNHLKARIIDRLIGSSDNRVHRVANTVEKSSEPNLHIALRSEWQIFYLSFLTIFI